MSKGKKTKSSAEIERDELALAGPRMRILNDRPLASSEVHLDSLRLRTKLAPVYDILRHPETETPLSVAIYGDWGTGKTSAMKWLEGMLIEWNRNGDHSLGKPVRPVWFYPWKYHKKKDVWRGLIAEVILATISIRGATLERVKTAVKRFGLFLGRSFLHALSGMKLVHGEKSGASGEIYEEFQQLVRPAQAYLNEFEATLGKWIADTISDAGERMVIFIDDLDRCLPKVALQVLEALKLYLDIPDLIFVVGVDRVVIDQLIQKLYGDLGLEKHKSKKYLAKMFQIEVTVGPSDQQAEEFLDEQLAGLGNYESAYWTRDLADDERQLFRDVVLRLAQRNPREIKRLLNSALIHGAGALHIADQPFSFAQGMQVFLVRRVLDERYTMGLSVDTTAGMEFFHGWSEIVRQGNRATVSDREFMASEQREASGLDSEHVEQPQLASPYTELLTEPGFAHLRRLLRDRDLGELMRIEYPRDTSAMAEGYVQDLPQGLIREAIARQLGKSASELMTSDYRHVVELGLEEKEIVDISPLQALTELRSLDLSNTQVVDLTPIARLDKLESLVLTRTPVVDLSPLRQLGRLSMLSLASTRVVDLDALRRLPRLESLNLSHTPVSSLDALRALTRLEVLQLVNVRVTDPSPLHALTALQQLNLNRTTISDLAPLASMTELEYLYLSYTKVADLGPLAGLRRLKQLSLAGTLVSDLAPLHDLTELQVVDVEKCQVPESAIAALRRARPKVDIRS